METTTRKPYDPGFKGTITSEGRGRFVVESFKKRGEHYSVDLAEGTCTCPHFINRLAPKIEAGETPAPCKHIEAAEFLSFQIALHIARQLSARNLRHQASRTDLRPEITEAVRIVLDYRNEVEEAFENVPADAEALAIAA